MPTVVIDPGHGGSTKVGGSSPNNAAGPNGLLEKDVALDIGRRVATLLANRATVLLTRSSDENRSLVDRAKVARDANADIFLSIHLNGWKDANVDGSEAWVARRASASSHALARGVLDRVVNVTHARDRGVKAEDFGVLLPERQGPHTAASLLEIAFLTNVDEATRFSHEDYKQALAQAIADGIAAQLRANGTNGANGSTAQALTTTEQQEAIDIVNAFKAETTAGSFTPRRDDVADRAIALVNDPTLVEQGALGLCGPAAVHRLWIKRDPKGFARYVTSLYDTGDGSIGSRSISAGTDLKDQDYYGNAVPKMQAVASDPANAAQFVCPSADWVAMSSLRDASNIFLDFEGLPEEDYSAGTTSAEVAAWLTSTGVYASVSDEGNFVFTKGLDHAEALRPGLDTDVVLLINAHILTPSAVQGHTKSDEFIGRAFPNHFVVLESAITEPTPDEVEFDCWTWGAKVHVRLNKTVFNPNYYGAIIARTTGPATSSALSGTAVTPTTIFLAPQSGGYFDYVQPATMGDLKPLINGASWNPANNLTEPLDEMQASVAATTAGDRVYLAAWFFEPQTPLTGGAYGTAQNWGQLLAAKASEGVIVRILQTDFDANYFKGVRDNLTIAWYPYLDSLINALPYDVQDNLKYVVSLHPAHTNVLSWMTLGIKPTAYIASHHQKFMVVKRGAETTAFCGGLDIESRKTPSRWSVPPRAPAKPLSGWHDIHVRMQGPIARDLEKEFTLRWNREKDNSTFPALTGWSGFETLPVPSPAQTGELDAAADKQIQQVQMIRTVSDDATLSAFDTKRDDIVNVYKNIVNSSGSFLYFENQYFRSLELADAIAARGRANGDLVAIFVVVRSSKDDDADNAVTTHGDHLEKEFFRRVTDAFGSRVGIYTMLWRAVHSKFVLADDRWMTIGSANANDRSFKLDSELNVAVDDASLTGRLRNRLWAYDLGVAETDVASWSVGSFLQHWNDVANANQTLLDQGIAANSVATVRSMAGEAVLPFNWQNLPDDTLLPVPDYLATIDFDQQDTPAGVDTGASALPDGGDSGTAVA
jgi:N-acetylmuramoyl-L-alanine amidase/phosphatidylserine/phosphatidylglycerophosphate/cardiolipin synthase-like enzyme